MHWHPHHKQESSHPICPKPVKNIKKQHRLKNSPGFSPTWEPRGFNTKILQSRTWQLSQKSFFFLLGYKFIKYTLHQFCLSLACRKGALQAVKTDGSCLSLWRRRVSHGSWLCSPRSSGTTVCEQIHVSNVGLCNQRSLLWPGKVRGMKILLPPGLPFTNNCCGNAAPG